ncbi:MAG: DUF202 domain-containing protein [Pseudomonadota bacterium]
MAVEGKENPSSNELAKQRTDWASLRTRWAADRTLWAADRTFIAWLRTAISLIGFGITIGKGGELLERQGYLGEAYNLPQIIGVSFILLAVLGLVGALIQDYRIETRLARQGFERVEPVPLGLAMGCLVVAVAIVGCIFIFI